MACAFCMKWRRRLTFGLLGQPKKRPLSSDVDTTVLLKSIDYQENIIVMEYRDMTVAYPVQFDIHGELKSPALAQVHVAGADLIHRWISKNTRWKSDLHEGMKLDVHDELEKRGCNCHG